jgi:hypothetical protein
MFAQILLNLVFQLVINQGLTFDTMQFVQFAIIMYLLFFSRLMKFFENIKFLLELLKIEHCWKKHWCDNVSWGMVEILHTIVVQAIRVGLARIETRGQKIVRAFGSMYIHWVWLLDLDQDPT